MEKEYFTWTELLETDLNYLGFGDCLIIKDFGVMLKGEKYASIFLDLEAGYLTAFRNKEDETPSCGFKIGLAAKC